MRNKKEKRKEGEKERGFSRNYRPTVEFNKNKKETRSERRLNDHWKDFISKGYESVGILLKTRRTLVTIVIQARTNRDDVGRPPCNLESRANVVSQGRQAC